MSGDLSTFNKKNQSFFLVVSALHSFACNLDIPFPMTVMDPTPFEHKQTLQERHSNPQHGMDGTATMQTSEVSTEKEHVDAGNLQFLISLQT